MLETPLVGDKQAPPNHPAALHEVKKTGKEFKCYYENCTKKYESKSNFLIHLRSHTGDKPFQCDFCLKGYPSKGNLKKHLKLHMQDKFKLSEE
jgi:KRAB domain-containing zinc finger protein